MGGVETRVWDREPEQSDMQEDTGPRSVIAVPSRSVFDFSVHFAEQREGSAF